MPVNGEKAERATYELKRIGKSSGNQIGGATVLGNVETDGTRQKSTSIPADRENKELVCGWGFIAPNFLQRFCKVEIFLAACCCYSFSQGFVVGGLISVVLSTIERRFDLNSLQSGMIAMGFDLAAILCLIPVSFYGGQSHRPRWIATGSFIMGLGSLMFASPHFLSDNYSYKGAKDRTILCGIGDSFNCSTVDAGSPAKKPHQSVFMFVMFFANMLHGVGASPVFTLAVAFLDENTPKKQTPIYIAIYYSMALIGPAAGYIVGGKTLERYVDVGSKTNMKPSDHQWLGAWWIGFLVSASLLFLVSVVISAFPRDLPGKEQVMLEKKLHKIEMMENFHDTDDSQENIAESLKKLFLNPIFGSINLCAAAESALISGFVTFAPKFVETSFNISASSAAQLMGLCTIPSGGLGIVTGGFAVKKFNLGGQSSLKMCLFCIAAGLLLSVALLVRCDDTLFAGINHPYGNETSVRGPGDHELNAPCNSDCLCSAYDVDPVCSSDRVNFISPCHAGCRKHYEDEGRKMYDDCSCLAGHRNQRVREGKCEGGECRLLGLFLFLYSVVIFTTFISCTPLLTATMRAVPENQKALALGFQWVTVRVLGTVPAPLILGSVIDRACLFWKVEPCTDRVGSCILYTKERMSFFFFFIALFYKSLSLVFIIAAYGLMKRMVSTSSVFNQSKK